MTTQVDPFSELGFVEVTAPPGTEFEELGFVETQKSSKPKKQHFGVTKDVAKQIPVSALKGLGSVGDLMQHIVPFQGFEGAASPLVNELYQSLRPLLALSGINEEQLPVNFQVPTSAQIDHILGQLGINPEAQTPAGRILGKGIEAGTGGALLGMTNPLWAVPSMVGSALGQLVRELGLPEGVATTTEVATSLSPAGPTVRKVASALKKVPQKTASGITKLKGMIKPPKSSTAVSTDKAMKASEMIKKDINKAVNEITDRRLPFSKIAKKDAQVYDRFDNAFKALREEAKKIPEKKFGGEQLFDNLKKKAREAKQVPSPSPETKGYISEINRFRRNLAGKELTASEWERQYREINKGIKNLAESLNLKGEKAGRLKALNEVRELTEQSIVENFKEYPNFVKPFKSLNKAFSDLKNYESVNRLIQGSLQGPILKPEKFIKAVNSPKGKQILTKALGKDGFKEIQQITEDLAPADALFKMLDVKKNKLDSLVDLVHGHLPVAMLGLMVKGLRIPTKYLLGAKLLNRQLNNVLLSPVGRRNWKAAVEAIKQGDKKAFHQAAIQLNKVIKKEPDELFKEMNED